MLSNIKFLILCLVLPAFSMAKPLDYTELQFKDLDQMKKMVLDLVNEAQDITIKSQSKDEEDNKEELEQEAIEKLRMALNIILARPNTNDNMVSNLIQFVEPPLQGYNAFVDVLAGIATEATVGLNTQSLKVEYRVAYLHVLENLLAEFRPRIKEDKEYKEIFVKIKDADIEVDQKLKTHRRMKGMDSTQSPSVLADKILKDTFPTEKKKKKKSGWFW